MDASGTSYDLAGILTPTLWQFQSEVALTWKVKAVDKDGKTVAESSTWSYTKSVFGAPPMK